MIDVGAHHGSALMPFLNKGWSVFAFEPDVYNRATLLERLSKHKFQDLVFLDTRCVSNVSNKSVSFFTSEQSTGISGLSAFHETHHETQKVDITTLTDFFQDKTMPQVDFLKIDTEGHDLFVLQGYPWERGKPAVIECEFEDTKTVPLGYTFHDLAKFLVDKGYTVCVSEWHPIIRYGIRHDWNALKCYPCELADSKGWGNFLAFRDPLDEQALVAAVKKVLKVGKPDATKAPLQLQSPPLVIPAVNQYKSQEQRFRIEPSSNFSRIAPDQWRYTDSKAKQKLLVAVSENQTFAQRTLVGHVRIQADCAMTLNLSMGRHGKSEYEGASTFLALNAGEIKTVVLKKTFTHSHQASKLQIDVLTMSGADTAILTVDQLGIAESTDSVLKRLGAGELNTQTANRLFRQKD
jgi:FkbM family methyltransferase